MSLPAMRDTKICLWSGLSFLSVMPLGRLPRWCATETDISSPLEKKEPFRCQLDKMLIDANEGQPSDS